MAEIYLYLLVLICLGLLGWGLICPERIYQYPFFMGGIFVSFILPQAFALVNNPDPVIPRALERVLLMSCLCAAMCWLGYQLPISSKFLNRMDIPVNYQKVFHGGIVFVLISCLAQFLISQLPESARTNSTWTGIITIYQFFFGLVFPGFTILLLSTLQRPSLTKFILTAGAAALPLQTIILYGRRENTATFILAIGLSLYYCRRYIPPRWLAVVAIVSALAIIPLTSDYRMIANAGHWNQLLNLQPVEELHTFVEKGQVLELRNAALLMDATFKTGQYGYGTDYWNHLVFRFVPAQFVGYGFKNALKLDFSLLFKDFNYELYKIYNYNIPLGSTSTGIADAFIGFDYLGSLFFLILGYFFKHLWISAVYKNSLISKIFYVSLVAPAMLSVTHGTIGFPPDLLFYCIFLGALVIYSRQKPVSEIRVGSKFHDA